MVWNDTASFAIQVVGADEDWSPPAVDVSLKFGVSNQCLPVDDRDRVDETRLMFQVKVC